jgi:hypothetical protein
MFEKFKNFSKRKNYANFKSRVHSFKSKPLEQKTKRAFAMKTTTNLKSVSFWGKEAFNYDNLQKYKEEPCKIQASLDSIDREVDKRLLSFLSEELSKQSAHTPLFNATETSQLL